MAMSSKDKILGLAGLLAVLLLLGAGWFLQQREQVAQSQEEPPKVPPVVKPKVAEQVPGSAGQEAFDHLEGIYRSPNPMRDLELVYNLMESYRLLIKDPNDPYPRGGSNEDIVRALNGANRNRQVFLPTSHPAVAEGRLLDRWGTPLHFHYESGDQVAIRSAGPDGRLGSGDDFCWEM